MALVDVAFCILEPKIDPMHTVEVVILGHGHQPPALGDAGMLGAEAFFVILGVSERHLCGRCLGHGGLVEQQSSDASRAHEDSPQQELPKETRESYLHIRSA